MQLIKYLMSILMKQMMNSWTKHSWARRRRNLRSSRRFSSCSSNKWQTSKPATQCKCEIQIIQCVNRNNKCNHNRIRVRLRIERKTKQNNTIWRPWDRRGVKVWCQNRTTGTKKKSTTPNKCKKDPTVPMAKKMRVCPPAAAPYKTAKKVAFRMKNTDGPMSTPNLKTS